MEGTWAEVDGYSPSSLSQGLGTPCIPAHTAAPLQPSQQHPIRMHKEIPPHHYLARNRSKVPNRPHAGPTASPRGKPNTNAACRTSRASPEDRSTQKDEADVTSHGTWCVSPRDHLRPVSVSAGGHGRFLWEPGSWVGREGRKTATRCPGMSVGRKAAGREGHHSSPRAWGGEALNGSKGVQVPGKFCSAPAAAHKLRQEGIFCLFPNEAPEVRPSTLRGTLQHQRAGKGFNTHLQSLLHTQSGLHCLDVKGKALTGFPKTTNN